MVALRALSDLGSSETLLAANDNDTAANDDHYSGNSNDHPDTTLKPKVKVDSDKNLGYPHSHSHIDKQALRLLFARAVKTGGRAYFLGLALRGSVGFLVALIKVARGRANPSHALRQLYAPTSFRFANMIGGFAFIWNLTGNALLAVISANHHLITENMDTRPEKHEERYNHQYTKNKSFSWVIQNALTHSGITTKQKRMLATFTAGTLAGLAVLFETAENRVAAMQQFGVRALQASYNALETRNIVRFPHGDTALFSFACASIMYAYAMTPDTIPGEYYRWIVDHGRVSAHALGLNRRNNRAHESAAVVAVGLDEMIQSIKSDVVGGVDAAAVTVKNAVDGAVKYYWENVDSRGVLPIVPCEVIHPNELSCLRYNTALVFHTFTGIAPVYAALNFVPMLFLKTRKLLDDPISSISKGIHSTFISSSFLAAYVTIYMAGICAIRNLVRTKVLQRDHKVFYYILGAISSGLSILIERKDRRAELAMYVLPKGLQSLFLVLQRRKWVFHVRGSETVTCCLAMGVLMTFYQWEDKAVSPLVVKIFDKVIGRLEEGQQLHRRFHSNGRIAMDIKRTTRSPSNWTFNTRYERNSNSKRKRETKKGSGAIGRGLALPPSRRLARMEAGSSFRGVGKGTKERQPANAKGLMAFRARPVETRRKGTTPTPTPMSALRRDAAPTRAPQASRTAQKTRTQSIRAAVDAAAKTREHRSKFGLVALADRAPLAALDAIRKADFSTLGLLPPLVAAMQAMFGASNNTNSKPTPVQALAIPASLNLLPSSALLVGAETGSGKTLAYLLPLINRLKSEELQLQPLEEPPADSPPNHLLLASISSSKLRRLHRPRAIILVPSRDLVSQVTDVAKQICAHQVRLTVVALHARPAHPEQLAAKLASTPIDILVATPHTLREYISTRKIGVSRVTELVVDEADTLYDDSNEEDMDYIWAEIKKQTSATIEKSPSNDTKSTDSELNAEAGSTGPITTYISATFPVTMKSKISKTHDGKYLQIATPKLHRPSNSLKQLFMPVTSSTTKAALLLEVLKRSALSNERRVIVFVNSRDTATWLCDYLRSKNIVSEGMGGVFLATGQMDARVREAVLGLFKKRPTSTAVDLKREEALLNVALMNLSEKSSAIPSPPVNDNGNGGATRITKRVLPWSERVVILVSTDVASRGVDTTATDHVVLYDFPRSAIEYLHRVGRTARNGGRGRATSLLTHRDMRVADDIEQRIKRGNMFGRRPAAPVDDGWFADIVDDMLGLFSEKELEAEGGYLVEYIHEVVGRWGRWATRGRTPHERFAAAAVAGRQLLEARNVAAGEATERVERALAAASAGVHLHLHLQSPNQNYGESNNNSEYSNLLDYPTHDPVLREKAVLLLADEMLRASSSSALAAAADRRFNARAVFRSNSPPPSSNKSPHQNQNQNQQTQNHYHQQTRHKYQPQQNNTRTHRDLSADRRHHPQLQPQPQQQQQQQQQALRNPISADAYAQAQAQAAHAYATRAQAQQSQSYSMHTGTQSGRTQSQTSSSASASAVASATAIATSRTYDKSVPLERSSSSLSRGSSLSRSSSMRATRKGSVDNSDLYAHAVNSGGDHGGGVGGSTTGRLAVSSNGRGIQQQQRGLVQIQPPAMPMQMQMQIQQLLQEQQQRRPNLSRSLSRKG
ncbi:hypothetical protein HK100_004519 [Physocladia obscura]|uniref:Uncharacterized protein n=1 Tax=Physocladia obscura TaxID=109957 RepID=A0AAD5XCK1_9FUNG|nr:hypothetical protein HK100_004519 [Physocladia obscura]